MIGTDMARSIGEHAGVAEAREADQARRTKPTRTGRRVDARSAR